MHDLDIETRRIDGLGKLLFGGNTDGTSGVVENGPLFHGRTPN
jgi:hypothetical protein